MRLHAAEWGDFHYRITGVDAKGNARLEGGWQNNRPMGMHDQIRFRGEHLRGSSMRPANGFSIMKADILYFIPPTGVDLGQGPHRGRRAETLDRVPRQPRASGTHS